LPNTQSKAAAAIADDALGTHWQAKSVGPQLIAAAAEVMQGVCEEEVLG